VSCLDLVQEDLEEVNRASSRDLASGAEIDERRRRDAAPAERRERLPHEQFRRYVERE
jgi:hypothetical protein